MFKNFFRGVASMNAATKFEKARMQVTYSGDTHSPHEDDLQTILKALAGQDPETKALFALQTIVAKLKTSQSKKYWNYIMKNLVILDRAADERYFVKEVSMLELAEVEEYEAKQRYKQKNIEDLVACYFRYIKEKAAVYYQTKSSLNVAKDKRKQFFRGKDPEVILGEVASLKTLYNSAFEVFNTGANGHLKYKLNQYVFLLVLNTIMNILSTQYVAFICIVETFFEMDMYMASEALLAFKDFLKRTEDLISFTGNHQFIPGFQISLHELRNPTADAKLLNSMQEYIKILEEEEQKGNRAARPSVDAFNIPREDLQPKRSEINIALFAGQFVAEKVPSDDELMEDNSSPPKSSSKTAESFYTSDGRPSGSPRKSDMLAVSGKKNMNTAFENTFQVGYRGLVSLSENITEQQLDDYKAPEPEVLPEQQGNGENGDATTETNEVLAYRHLTPAFNKLTNIEEEDLLFKDFDCFFSYSAEGQSPTLKQPTMNTSGRWSRPTPELKTVGIVLTKCEDIAKGKEDEISMIDFEVDIFSRFKNLYSHEYRA